MNDNRLTAEQRERLKQALAAGSRLGASDLRLLNVDVYRERLGDKWFKYKGIIHALAAGAIKAELGPEDFYVETKAGYGIFFFQKHVVDARQIADRIAARLQKDLSREPAFGDPPIGCQARSINCAEFLCELEHRHAEEPAPPAKTEGRPVHVARTPPSSYAPLWHVRMERILGSVFAPPVQNSASRMSERDYYAPAEAFAVRDLSGFNAMLSDAYKLHKAGQCTTILFALNFKTFCSPEFHKDYVQALRQTPAALVQYLTPRFVRIPPGTPQTMIAAKVQTLSAIFQHVVFHTRPLIELQSLEFVPCSILSTSWKDITRSLSANRTEQALARQFAQSARSLRMNSLITGADSGVAFEVALGAGVEFISGEAIAPLADQPFSQEPLSLKQVANAAPAPVMPRSSGKAPTSEVEVI